MNQHPEHEKPHDDEDPYASRREGPRNDRLASLNWRLRGIASGAVPVAAVGSLPVRLHGLRLLAGLPALLAIVVGAVVLVASPRKMNGAYRSMATEALSAKDYAKATICIDRLLQSDPDNETLKLMLARAYDGQGRTELVDSLLQRIAPVDRPGSADAHAWLAERLLKRPSLTDAQLREIESHLLKLDPARRMTKEVAALLAQVYLLTGRIEEAKQYLDVTDLAARPNVRVALAQAYAARGDSQKALAAADQAVADLRAKLVRRPDDAEGRRQLADALLVTCDFAAAAAVLSEGLTLGPPDAFASKLGEVCVRAIGYRGVSPRTPTTPSRETLSLAAESLVAYTPASPTRAGMLTQLYMALHRPKDAAKTLAELMEVNPGVGLDLARLQQTEGDAATARKTAETTFSRLEAAIREKPTDPTMRARGIEALCYLQRYPEAVRLAQESVDRTGQKAFRSLLAGSYVAWWDAIEQKRAPKVEKPLDLLQKALAADPWNSDLLLRLVNATHGPDAAAAKQLIQAIMANGEAPAVAHFILGSDAFLRGEGALARTHLEQANRLQPNHPTVLNNFAHILANTNPPDFDRALELIDSAIRISPGFAELHDTRGRIHHRMGRWREALADLETCLALKRNDRDFHRIIAEVYTNLGMPDPAAEHRRIADTLEGRK